MARASGIGGRKTKPKAGKAIQAKGRKAAKTKRRVARAAKPHKDRSIAEMEAEVEELLRQQTATTEILRVINASQGDLKPVFDTILEKAHSLCDVPCGSLQLIDGDYIREVAVRGQTEAFEKFLRQGYRISDRVRQSLNAGQVVHNVDMAELRIPDEPAVRAAVELGGIRTLLALPLAKNGVSFGRIVAARQEVRPFTDRQIGLLKGFADQAVIAIENARLFNEVQQRTRELSQSLDHLRAAQDRLVQTEKLASLGQLTAGIAHEIKNPLNFVNNFSGMSAELIGELQDIVSSLSIDRETLADIKELTGMLSANLEKILQHGKRADAVVKSMLLHSGQGSGERRPSDINALVDECLNRAYYGERAETRGFTIKLERSFDPAVGEVDLFPREISRALLNLISNGCYATSKRKETEGSDYEPVLIAATRSLGDRVEIRIFDNGSGIPTDVKDKMFDPFFTTKPPGEGTGLGLSITHDIIVKQHGGSIEVDTKPGEFAEIRLILPRR